VTSDLSTSLASVKMYPSSVKTRCDSRENDKKFQSMFLEFLNLLQTQERFSKLKLLIVTALLGTGVISDGEVS